MATPDANPSRIRDLTCRVYDTLSIEFGIFECGHRGLSSDLHQRQNKVIVHGKTHLIVVVLSDVVARSVPGAVVHYKL